MSALALTPFKASARCALQEAMPVTAWGVAREGGGQAGSASLINVAKNKSFLVKEVKAVKNWLAAVDNFCK